MDLNLDQASDTPKEDLKDLQDLVKQRCFQTFLKVLKENAHEAIVSLADPNISGLQAHIDHQRGVVYAISNIPTLIEKRMARLEGQLMMEDLEKGAAKTHTNEED